MRWFVEVSRIGHDDAGQKLCVEAKQWQAALQEARRMKGESGPLSRFSIELLDKGYRAVDPASKVRYIVNRAPKDAPLTDPATVQKGNGAANKSSAPAGAVPRPAASAAPASKASAPPRPSSKQAMSGPATEKMSKPVPSASNPAMKAAAPAKPSAEPVPKPAPKTEAPVESVRKTQPSAQPAKMPDFEIVRKREEERTEQNPITYREIAYAVSDDTPKESAEILLWARFNEVAAKLDELPPGKFVQLAVFDHVFEKRPKRPPIATLAWKDWRGSPVVAFPEQPPPSTEPQGAKPAAEAKAPAPEADDGSIDVEIESPPAAEAKAPSKLAEETAKAKPGGKAKWPPSGEYVAHSRRRKDEDLIGELFERMHDLHFMQDIVAGCEFLLTVLDETLPCEGVVLHVFDIDTSHFVVVRAKGPEAGKALMHRTPDQDAFFRKQMRGSGVRQFAGEDRPEYYLADPWKKLGVDVQSAVFGPSRQGGRYLGAIELANPEGGGPFADSEVNAVEYICEQFAEFLAQRPIIVDAEAILPK